MTTYIYKCRDCGHVYEVSRRFSGNEEEFACNQEVDDNDGEAARCYGQVKRDYKAENVNVDKGSLK